MDNLYFGVRYNEKRIAFVRSSGGKTRLLSGQVIALSFFPHGQVDLTNTDLPVTIELVASDPSHPAIGDWLNGCRIKMRKVVRVLSDTEKDQIRKLLRQGVALGYVAERFNVSRSTVKRLKAE